MRTIEISPADMERRVARFDRIKPLVAQTDGRLPQAALDIIYARKLMPVIGLEGGTRTPISETAPIAGAGGMTVTLAVCPPGQGPGLHAHVRTFETFTVLKGRFEITWNDEGQSRLELGLHDTVSVPPGVCRAFRNCGDEEGILQVIITGGVNDMNDIDCPAAMARALDATGPGVLDEVKKLGITFTASKDAA